MNKKLHHILIFEFDIQKYPPILSVIFFLLKNNEKVVVFSQSSDKVFVKYLENKGVIFYNSISNNTESNSLKKLFRLFRFKNFVNTEIHKFQPKKVWLFGQTASWIFNDFVFLFETVIYLFEVPKFKIPMRYRLLSPNIDYGNILNTASKVICCEYNRAHITKAYFNLAELPLVIPNKPYLMQDIENNSLNEIDHLLEKQLEGKKIILYQGIFNYPERKMDALCDAIEFLPNEFVVCLMGLDNEYKKKLKLKYKDNKRIFFLPYVKAPQHLLVTKKAYIGYLSYNSEANNIRNSLNTLFCAPNKIFEYSKYSIPMLSNDVPALKFLFDTYHAGRVSDNTAKSIAHSILEIEKQYVAFSKGAEALFNSIDIESLLSKI